jgi:hypothetical protein
MLECRRLSRTSRAEEERKRGRLENEENEEGVEKREEEEGCGTNSNK